MKIYAKRIGDLFDRFSSGKNLTEEKIHESGNFPVYGGNGLRGYTDNCNFKGECLIVGRQGAKCGNVRYFSGEGYMTDHAIVGVANSENSTQYLTYALAALNLNRLSGQSAQPGLAVSMLKKQKVLVPLYETQVKIADTISTYDSLIEVNKKRIKVLEQMAENLYKEWFVRFRFPGYETAEFENGIPKGWEYKTVEGLSCVLQRGISPDYDDDGEYSVISQKCIRQSIMDFSEARKHTRKFKSELNILDGDTVICSTGTGTLGRVGQVYGAYQNTTFDSHVTLVRANNDVGSHFLFWALKNMQPWFMNMGIGSTNQQELYRSTIKNAKILVPDEASNLTERFDSYVDPIHKQICILRDKTQNLIIQRDLLLPRLMSGKLEV